MNGTAGTLANASSRAFVAICSAESLDLRRARRPVGRLSLAVGPRAASLVPAGVGALPCPLPGGALGFDDEWRRACEADLETAATPWLEQGRAALADALGACSSGGAVRAALPNDCENIAAVSRQMILEAEDGQEIVDDGGGSPTGYQ